MVLRPLSHPYHRLMAIWCIVLFYAYAFLLLLSFRRKVVSVCSRVGLLSRLCKVRVCETIRRSGLCSVPASILRTIYASDTGASVTVGKLCTHLTCYPKANATGKRYAMDVLRMVRSDFFRGRAIVSANSQTKKALQ